MRFIDLFAGLGGFHLALHSLGHKGVFASEIDTDLAALYEKNFKLKPHGDIRALNIEDIPAHDILCAGFPCQPFSKAGGQKGFECPQWGDLFDYVIDTLRTHKPRYLIIENVPNLARHNEGKTWKTILRRLKLAGYTVSDATLSPHQFGVPQVRERAFIVGCRDGLDGFAWPEAIPQSEFSIRKILDENPKDARRLPEQFVRYINAWQKFLDLFPKDEQLPSFPIWAMEFGATYPYSQNTPRRIGLRNIRSTKGALGISLRDLTSREVLEALPAYARDSSTKFPLWKIDFIRQNRELYKKHRKWIDQWIPSIREFAPSFQKLEWNCQGEPRDLWQYVLQFRASGIRTKRPTTAPSLVAMTTSQVPVIGWERRYMTIRECSRLQSMGSLELPETHTKAFKALGNAVNVDVVKAIASALLPKPTQAKAAKAGPRDIEQRARNEFASAA